MQIKDLTEFVQIMERSGLGDEYLQSDHDVIYGPSLRDIQFNVSREDLAKLIELGWKESDEYDCLSHYL